MANTTTYHVDIGLPPVALGLSFATMLRYTKHALDAARDDRYGPVELPKVFNSTQARLIEATVEGEKVVKAVYRQPLDDWRDLCLVIALETSRVLTVWVNEKLDHHKTLDRSKYGVL